MKLVFKNINEELYKCETETGSILEVYREPVDEDIQLHARWTWKIHIYLSESAKSSAVAGRLSSELTDCSDVVYFEPTEAISRCCFHLSKLFRVKINYEIED